jgi:hypothetical protein
MDHDRPLFRLTARDRELVGATDRFEARLRQLNVVGRSGWTMDRIMHEHPDVRPLFEDALEESLRNAMRRLDINPDAPLTPRQQAAVDRLRAKARQLLASDGPSARLPR